MTRFLAAATCMAWSLGAFAQAGAQPEGDEAPLVLKPLTVTGYHVKRIDLEGPAPLVVFDREELAALGHQTLEDFAQFLPINRPHEPSLFEAIGVTGFDLRGIGVDTTLTLVNGQRIAPYAQLAQNTVDINSIPVSAIDRIEILKDGASAIYGADAIAGVVNIILRDRFDGLELSAGYGVTERGDGQETLADLVTGREGERGGVMFSLSWYRRGPQAMRDRGWSDDTDFSSIGGPDRRSAFGSPPGFFRWDTGVAEADPACGSNPRAGSVGDFHWYGLHLGVTCKYNFAQDADLLRDIERVGASLSGRYALGPRLSVFGDLLFSRVEAEVDNAPAPITESPLGPIWPYVPAGHPNNPFGAEGELMSRPLGLGNRIHVNVSDAFRAVLGVESFAGPWDWQLSVLASENQADKHYLNMVSDARYQYALLGMGGTDGNLWYNPFGFRSPNDPAVVDWLTTGARSSDTSGEYSADLLVSRLLGSLPGGAAGVALGLQYRRQELEQWADEGLLSGEVGFTHEPVTAERSIFSAFAELSLPLLPGLEAQLALRYEDYSDFGSTANPKLAMRWQPLESLAFRGSYSTSFKPPSFYELYFPVQETWGWFRDVERCGYTGEKQDCDGRYYPLEARGNPGLDPEDGTSWFAGIAWSPEYLPGLEFELDFWQFHHKQRISYLPAQYVLDEQGDFGIVRAPREADRTPGAILLVSETVVNSDALRTRGLDATVGYRWRTSRAGDFRASLMHTYLDEWRLTDTSLLEAGYDENLAGLYSWGGPLPRHRANLGLAWNRGDHAASANIHLVGGYTSYEYLWVNGEETDKPMEVPGYASVDLQYRHHFSGLKNAVLRIGCNNATDEEPSRALYWPVNEPLYDPRGRYWYVRWQQPIR